MTAQQEKIRLYAAAAIVLFGLVFSLVVLRSLWTLDASGLSQLNRKLPIWDFSNLWAGGLLALQGKVDVLFEPDLYRETLRNLFTPLLSDQEWSYPPSMLLVGAPLALLPVLPAYILWTAGTIGLLHLAIRPLKMPWPLHLAALVSPSVVMNMVVGQNGAWTASLLIGGLLLAPRRPLLAGFLFGLLTMKPHLGLLVPFCLLASRNGRAILSASVTTVLLAAVTAALFGADVWLQFRSVTTPLMTGILEAPYPQTYHTLALTVFAMLRSLGAGLPLTYGIQAIVTLLCMVLAFWLWRPQTRVAPERRAVLTALLTLIATPYGYIYDSVPLGVAVAWLFWNERRIPLAVHAAAWLLPLFVPSLVLHGFGASILVVLAYAALGLGLVWRDQRGVEAPLTASAAPPSR